MPKHIKPPPQPQNDCKANFEAKIPPNYDDIAKQWANMLSGTDIHIALEQQATRKKRREKLYKNILTVIIMFSAGLFIGLAVFSYIFLI